jgi:hypothetical protein
VLTLLLNVLAAMLPHAFEAYSELMEPLMDGSVRLTVLYVLLIGPVSEELIFRGALLDRFHLAFPFLAANALQAALFGIYHMNLTQGVYAFCLGFVLGLIRYVTGSILANMLAHILFNATSYALDLFFPAGQAAQLAAIAAGAVLGCAWFVWSLRYLWKAAKRKEG